MTCLPQNIECLQIINNRSCDMKCCPKLILKLHCSKKVLFCKVWIIIVLCNFAENVPCPSEQQWSHGRRSTISVSFYIFWWLHWQRAALCPLWPLHPAYNNLKMAQSEYNIWFLFPVNHCALIRRQQQQLFLPAKLKSPPHFKHKSGGFTLARPSCMKTRFLLLQWRI